MKEDQGQRSAIGGDQPSGHYNEPKGRIFERAANELRDVVVFGKDQSGKLQLWASGDQSSTAALFEQVQQSVLEPTT